MLEFVSYDGKWPNLCSGTLKMRLDGETITFPDYCLSSGGGVNWRKGKTSHGDWTIRKWPEGFPECLQEYATFLVNKHISKGCCGGCI